MVRETFEFTGQSFSGLVPTLGSSLVVVDNNVMSVLESVARKGFALDNIQHRRASHLLKWLNARNDDAIFTLFGVLEGAGFHAGGVSSYQMLRRAVATAAVVGWARENVDDMVKVTEPLPRAAWRTGAVDPDDALEFAQELLPLTVLPCYVACLAAVEAWRRNDAPLEKAQRVHDRLAKDLDFIPMFGWLATALLLLGRSPVRNKLETSVFKLRGADVRRSCLSAAWDLGYLQLMSLARSPGLGEIFGGRSPVLVTDDSALPWLNSLVSCHGDTPVFTVEPREFDPRFAREAVALLARNQRARILGQGSVPDWDQCARAASDLERELGIEDAPALRLHPPVTKVALGAEDVEAYLRVLECGTGELALATITECGVEAALWGGIVAVGRLVADNAAVRNRTITDSWDSVLANLAPGALDLWMVQMAVHLPRAQAEGSWRLFSAMIGKLQVEGGWTGVALFLWHLGRLVLEDTAGARSTTVEDLVALLLSKTRSVQERRTSASRAGPRAP